MNKPGKYVPRFMPTKGSQEKLEDYRSKRVTSYASVMRTMLHMVATGELVTKEGKNFFE